MKAVLSAILLLFFAASCAAQSSIDTIQLDTVYVDSYGVDQGYCNVSTAPCASLGYALDRLRYNNPGCHDQNASLRGGWAETVNVALRCGALTLNGTPGQTYLSGSPGSCATIISNFNSLVQIRNMQVQGIGSACNSVLYAQNGGRINILDGVIFSSAYGAHLLAEGTGSAIMQWAPYTIIGGAWVHARVVAGAHVGLTANPIIFENAPTFSGPFFSVVANGNITLGGTTFTGNINYSGQAYTVDSNSTIWVHTAGGCGIIPGTTGSATRNGMCFQ